MEWEGAPSRIWPAVAGAEVTLSPPRQPRGKGWLRSRLASFNPSLKGGRVLTGGLASDQSPTFPGGHSECPAEIQRRRKLLAELSPDAWCLCSWSLCVRVFVFSFANPLIGSVGQLLQWWFLGAGGIPVTRQVVGMVLALSEGSAFNQPSREAGAGRGGAGDAGPGLAARPPDWALGRLCPPSVPNKLKRNQLCWSSQEIRGLNAQIK